MSFTATNSISLSSRAVRKIFLPIRPNPLIPTLTAILVLRSCLHTSAAAVEQNKHNRVNVEKELQDNARQAAVSSSGFRVKFEFPTRILRALYEGATRDLSGCFKLGTG